MQSLSHNTQYLQSFYQIPSFSDGGWLVAVMM